MEDSPTDVFVIGEALAVCGLAIQLRVLSDGDAALARLRNIESGEETETPDLVLLDLNVPRASGMEVLAALRSSACCAAVPVVVVTSSDSSRDLEEIRALKATAYFKKPHDLDEFMRLSIVVKDALAGGAAS